MDTLNGLERLLVAEARASELIDRAEIEAGNIIGKAREAALVSERQSLTEMSAALESGILDFGMEIKSKSRSELDEFQRLLSSAPLNEDSFARSCRKFMSSRD
jgi:vacuolar-type H+-ATPase subunit H